MPELARQTRVRPLTLIDVVQLVEVLQHGDAPKVKRALQNLCFDATHGRIGQLLLRFVSPSVVRCFGHADPKVRRWASKAIALAGVPEDLVDAVFSYADRETDRENQGWMLAALSTLGLASRLPRGNRLAQFVGDLPEAAVAALVLSDTTEPVFTRGFASSQASGDIQACLWLALLVGHRPLSDELPRVQEQLTHSAANVVEYSIWAQVATRHWKSTDLILRAIAARHAEAGVHSWGLRYLAELFGSTLTHGETFLALYRSSTDPDARVAAAIGLGSYDAEPVVALLAELYFIETDAQVRCALLQALTAQTRFAGRAKREIESFIPLERNSDALLTMLVVACNMSSSELAETLIRLHAPLILASQYLEELTLPLAYLAHLTAKPTLANFLKDVQLCLRSAIPAPGLALLPNDILSRFRAPELGSLSQLVDALLMVTQVNSLRGDSRALMAALTGCQRALKEVVESIIRELPATTLEYRLASQCQFLQRFIETAAILLRGVEQWMAHGAQSRTFCERAASEFHALSELVLERTQKHTLLGYSSYARALAALPARSTAHLTALAGLRTFAISHTQAVTQFQMGHNAQLANEVLPIESRVAGSFKDAASDASLQMSDLYPSLTFPFPSPAAWLLPGNDRGLEVQLTGTDLDVTVPLAPEWGSLALFAPRLRITGLTKTNAQLFRELLPFGDNTSPASSLRARVSLRCDPDELALIALDLELSDSLVFGWGRVPISKGAVKSPTSLGGRMKFFNFASAQEAHFYLLFIDIVGFSKADRQAQLEMFKQIQEAAIGSETLGGVPDSTFEVLLTGDGYCVAFHDSTLALAPIRVASDIQRKLRRASAIKLRMAVHDGPAYLVESSAGAKQVIGLAVNQCARVLSGALEGGVCVSESYAKSHLEQTDDPLVKALKKSEVRTITAKHGEEFRVLDIDWP